MSDDESSSDSDAFVDAEESFYDTRGRPVLFRYSSAVLSSTTRTKNSSFEGVNVATDNDTKLPLIPEISVTDTSLEGEQTGERENRPGLVQTDTSEESDVDLEIPKGPPRTEKESILLSQAQYHGHIVQQTSENEAPEVTIYIKDLDTGERVPVTDVEEKLKESNKGNIDPLSFHILKRTGVESELSSPTLDDDATLSRNGSWDGLTTLNSNEMEAFSDGDKHGDKENKKSNRRSKLFLNRLTKRSSRHEKVEEDEGDNVLTGNTAPVFSDSLSEYGRAQPHYIKVRTRHKSIKEFNRLFLAQELFNNDSTKSGAIWTMKFSKDGKFLATGGQDTIVRVWAVISSDEEREHFLEGSGTSVYEGQSGEKLGAPVFRDKPLYEYVGHTADVLDLSWSKNNFLLSSSMDKTVRLWHMTRKECLCCFQHTDFVTAIAFHPKDDRFFLSGSLDCKLRLWNIPEKRVAHWNELRDSQLITAVGFTLDGKITLAGSFSGLCLFYETDGLKYNTQIHVRSTRGRNSKGKKITGIEAMPGTIPGQDKLLITSNDSRVRLYNMRDKSLECKYKGPENTCSQIRATFSDDGRYIISGSEDRHVYIWNTDQSRHYSANSGSGGWLKKEKIGFEAFEAHSNIVTVAIFAPTRTKQLMALCGDPIFCNTLNNDLTGNPIPPDNQTYPDGNIIVCADYTGRIKIFRNDCSYYPKIDQDSISIRSTRSWNSALGVLLSRSGKGGYNRRRRLSDTSSVYSVGTPSVTSIDGPINEET